MKINNNFFKLIQFQNTSAYNANTNFGSKNKLKFSFANNPLAPLNQDTVSFSGRKKNSQVQEKSDEVAESFRIKTSASSHEDKKINHADRASRNATQALHDESYYAFERLKLVLKEAFPKNHIIDVDSSNAEERITRALMEERDVPVVMIVARKKTPFSISEKMAQMHVSSKAAAKEKISDIIGARIIVASADKKGADYALDRLTESVKKGRLKIKRIKNHGQPQKALNYASQPKIDKLLNAARANGSKNCDFLDQPRDSGYLALHILTDEIEDGYCAEIQIMGRDVENFKSLEDLCYKCMCDKGVPSKYTAIKNMFNAVHENSELKNAYLEYTKRAYAFERKKTNATRKDTADGYFPIPKDLSDIIPKNLDFNHIARMKQIADINEESMLSADNSKKYLKANKIL